MPRPRWCVAIGFLLGGLPGGAAAAPAPSVEELTGETIRRLSLQTALPQVPGPTNLTLSIPDVVLWVVIATAALLLLYSLREVRWRRRAEATGWQEQSGQAVSDQDSHLGRAADYARQARFMEAMHELLLDAFREIRERAAARMADSLTSREILRTATLPDQGQAALRAIVMRVEWTYYGDRAATAADYQECRSNHAVLTASLRRDGAG